MAKSGGFMSPLDHSDKEGHGDNATAPGLITKGKFESPATFVPLSKTATSSDSKTGNPGGVKPLS